MWKIYAVALIWFILVFYVAHRVFEAVKNKTNTGNDDSLCESQRKVEKDSIQANVNWY